MSDDILKKLKTWRRNIANTTGVELFRVLPNKVLEDIARLKPTCKDDLLAVKGIREKKFSLYGNDILAIIQECTGQRQEETEDDQEEDKIYSVSDYLDVLNSKLSKISATVKGEVSSISFSKGHAYYSIKDKDDESVLRCFMWANDYEMCGIELVEGMEIIIHGFPSVHKPNGMFSFRTKIIELVGEGALKKAYEALKKKLEAEGLFMEERKKAIPIFPHRIGLITSRDGAVIGDFSTNIGKFGYKIMFLDSRVEGAAAISDLISAVEYFEDKDIDVLVIIRGGGSLESLQAFNNEMLVRKVANLKMPVICGIGHDKDMPLLSYVADKAVSTPTAVAQALNRSWEQAVGKLESYEKTIIFHCEECLGNTRYKLEKAGDKIKEFYQDIFKMFEKSEQNIKNIVYNFGYVLHSNKERLEKASFEMKNFYKGIFGKFDQYRKNIKNNITNISHIIRHEKYKIQKMKEALLARFRDGLNTIGKALNNLEKELNQSNPERQLKLGYSIATLNGKVVRSASQVKKGDILINKLGDGNVQSEVQETFDN